MEYATGRSTAGIGLPSTVSNQAIEAKTLETLLDRMNKELHGLGDSVARLGQFKNRLLNPRPQGVGEKPVETPPSTSVEGRLQGLIQMANNMGAHLHDIVNELERSA